MSPTHQHMPAASAPRQLLPARAGAPPIRAISTQDMNLNSLSRTRTPNIKFTRPEDHDDPLIAMRCSKPVATCMEIRSWLFQQQDAHANDSPETLRMDDLELENINKSDEGTLLYLDRAAYFPNQGSLLPVSILALLMPKDHRVRWFYSLPPIKSLLEHLIELKYICLRKAFSHSRLRNPHCRLYVYMREGFLKAFQIPDHPDYLNAITMTDFAPSILDPDTAYRRLEGNEFLQQNRPPRNGKDMEDDRYKEKVHPAEVELASNADLGVAQYLFIKRNFFKEFYEEVMKTEKKIDIPQGNAESRHRAGRNRKKKKEKAVVVRTDHAHQQWLEKVYRWGKGRAKRLVIGWRVLGLLEERRLLPWIKNGGMLVESLRAEMEDDDVDEDEDKDGGEDGDEGEREKDAEDAVERADSMDLDDTRGQRNTAGDVVDAPSGMVHATLVTGRSRR